MRHRISRLPNWDERLRNVFAMADASSFVWGEWDCVRFAALCVEAVTGHDPRPAIMPSYRGKSGALRRLRQYGYQSMADAATARFGPPLPALAARPGDLVAAGNHALGAVSLDGAAAVFLAAPRGALRLPLAQAAWSWKIG